MQSQSVTGITVTEHYYEKYSAGMWDCSITKLPLRDFSFLQNFKVHVRGVLWTTNGPVKKKSDL